VQIASPPTTKQPSQHRSTVILMKIRICVKRQHNNNLTPKPTPTDARPNHPTTPATNTTPRASCPPSPGPWDKSRAADIRAQIVRRRPEQTRTATRDQVRLERPELTLRPKLLVLPPRVGGHSGRVRVVPIVLTVRLRRANLPFKQAGTGSSTLPRLHQEHNKKPASRF
jgi:hypothetical protein